jgi:hypothetical protein
MIFWKILASIPKKQLGKIVKLPKIHKDAYMFFSSHILLVPP